MTIEPAITGLAQANLPVSDLDRAVEFYERLGLAVDRRTSGAAFVTVEPGRSRLGLWKTGSPTADVTLETARSDADRSTAWLRSRGTEPTEVGDVVEFDDPFGNTLALAPAPEPAPVPAHEQPKTDEPPRTEPAGSEGSFVTGLNEAHLLLFDLAEAIAFYEDALGLPVAWQDDETAFVWTEQERSWLGLWEGWIPENHVAFEVSLPDLARSDTWLADRGIALREDSGFTEPYVRPHQPIGSAYFDDSEGNDLEFMCFLSMEPADDPAKIPLAEWLTTRA